MIIHFHSRRPLRQASACSAVSPGPKENPNAGQATNPSHGLGPNHESLIELPQDHRQPQHLYRLASPAQHPGYLLPVAFPDAHAHDGISAWPQVQAVSPACKVPGKVHRHTVRVIHRD